MYECLPVCIYMNLVPDTWDPQDTGYPGTGLTGSCELLGAEPGPLQEQQVLLTTKPFPQPFS